MICAVISVSKSGYYAWIKRGRIAKRKQENLSILVQSVFYENKQRYGSRRIQRVLHKRGYPMSRSRVSRVMKSLGLHSRPPRRFKITTDSNHQRPVAPNRLNRHFQVEDKNQAWVGDITYVYTKEGWLYLSVLIDLYSRKVIGYATATNLEASLPLRALEMALGTRKGLKNTIHHTDRGSQYTSHEYQRRLNVHGFQVSMSKKGDCWDNAVAESFFKTLKTESLNHFNFKTREEAHLEIISYLSWYNSARMHSSIGYMSPIEYENLNEYAAHVA